MSFAPMLMPMHSSVFLPTFGYGGGGSTNSGYLYLRPDPNNFLYSNSFGDLYKRPDSTPA